MREPCATTLPSIRPNRVRFPSRVVTRPARECRTCWTGCPSHHNICDNARHAVETGALRITCATTAAEPCPPQPNRPNRAEPRHVSHHVGENARPHRPNRVRCHHVRDNGRPIVPSRPHRPRFPPATKRQRSRPKAKRLRPCADRCGQPGGESPRLRPYADRWCHARPLNPASAALCGQMWSARRRKSASASLCAETEGGGSLRTRSAGRHRGTLVPGPPCGDNSPNSPRVGRQQG
jgi:hypothetical protein